MKSLKYALSLLLVFAPLFASAQSIPAFPMAFWGTVTINGSAAPVGTIVRAYYSSTLAGQVTLQNAGVYGYTEPTKQKLVLGQGTGTITFTVQSSSFNSGAETGGITAITYPQFTSGSTTQDDLAFAISNPTPTPTPPSSGGGGGGSSGGGGGVTIPPIAPPISTTTISTIIASTTSQIASVIGQVLGASTFNFTQNLQLGSIGDAVTQLQDILIADGFLNGSATGYFGSLTKNALKAYQAKHSISQTGTMGPLTRAQLNKDTSNTLTTTTAASSSISIAPITTGHVFTQSLKIGSHGSDVTFLQNVLIGLGLLQSQTTGYFGSLTASAVMAFQAKNGISQTGTVGPLTRAWLNK